MLNKEDKARYLRLLSYIHPLWKVVVLAIIATAIYGATEPLFPWIVNQLIDRGFNVDGERNFTAIYQIIIIMVVGFFIRGTANFASSYSTTWLAQKVVYTLRAQLFEKMQHLPMRYFDAHTQGSIVSKFTYDVTQLMSATTDTLISFLRDSVTILALIIYLFILDWKMALILMTAAPFVSWFIVYVSKRLRKMASALQADMGGINHVVDEALRGRAIVRIYNGFQHEYQRFDQQAGNVEAHALASKRISAMISPAIELIIVLSLSAVIIIAAHQDSSNGMTIGKFMSFLTAMGMLFSPVKRLGRLNESLQRGLAAMQSIFDFLDEPVEQEKYYPPKTISKGNITFHQLSFQYADEPVLKNFNLSIKAGETVALVGESGSGKSTLAALLAGFYPPDDGTIFIDDIDIATINLSDRRQAMAYVSQDTVLFSGTVAENIAYADTAPNRERIIAAAKSANADDFIQALPQGYDSDIGQQGGKLSGGQKQRLAIARALYKDAPILILDEATSALDNRSEQKVQEAIEHLRKNRTAIIIAHRLSTIENADRIVVLNQGEIIEEGNHQTLIEKNGFYAKLLNRHVS
ncbi:lipid A export permease/ATP-binding protein MsbA [Suttonella ornithocola]|uniref:Lipid A export ATP-binding/permease protein MsbA n=1 Tax=Suttonella ornithocola TaxID=279832 RepID=A0A380MP83_9GAMM|nr:lipid A export permease/ATP-binding protein MsbA [Suttonella ornithocola]SUO93693.1 Lipid A export ATP-binding/permease protein MsbA [Suttonella ornithocola]